jgi:hypothetical protein
MAEEDIWTEEGWGDGRYFVMKICHCVRYILFCNKTFEGQRECFMQHSFSIQVCKAVFLAFGPGLLTRMPSVPRIQQVVKGVMGLSCCVACTESGHAGASMFHILKKLRGLSPRANYTDRATAACRLRFLRIEGATWSAWRIPTAVFSAF